MILKLRRVRGEIHRVGESENLSNVILVTLRESYREIGRVPVNFYSIILNSFSNRILN